MRDRALKGTGILQALLTMDVVALASLLLAARTLVPEARHVAWGLGAALMNLVARCIAIFYMLASGRAVRDLVAEHGLGSSFVARSKRIKRVVETLATLALIPVMVAAVGGGAVRPGEPGAHAAWAWTSVLAAAACLAADLRAGLRNHALLREVDDLVRDRPSG